MDELVKDKTVKNFVLKVFKNLYEIDSFRKLTGNFVKTDSKRVSFKDENVSLASLFLISNYEDVKKINKEDSHHWRWFENDAFLVDEELWFLTGEWNAPESYSLSIPNIKKIVRRYYNLDILKNEEEWMLVRRNDSAAEEGKKSSFYCQKILFGAPGTGKSHKLDYDLFKDVNGNPLGKGLKSVSNDCKFRTTFHPDYDYAQFVGSYKPKKDKEDPKRIVYEFVPQVFAKVYVAAWNKFIAAGKKSTAENQVYLVIEEINRGNCAQIFGDIFQLLDRKNCHSEYPIDVDSDFADFIRAELADKFGDYKKEICSYCEDAADESQTADDEFCKIALPPNFNILATMNTSDQSLFPMDSAFKRRFDWEYVPIDYKKTEADFTIVIGDKKYRWLDFLKKVNADIYTATESEDKQMGEFFVKPSDGKTIDLPTFCSKVLFYLWDSVYKDDDQNKKIFRFDWKFDDEEKNRPVTFQSLFEDEKTKIAIVQKMMENLNVPEKQ